MSSSRIEAYIPLAQRFASLSLTFHGAVASRLGIHATDLKSLQLLGDRWMTAGELGERIGLTAAAATLLVDRLERAGFVVRHRSESDRRRVEVHAVPKKLKEAQAMYAAHSRRMAQLLARYTDTEFAVIADFLERTANVLAQETGHLAAGD